MESLIISELAMLRCRRCRKAFIDSSCLLLVAATDESAAALCSVWHVNLDKLPEWILTSVQQAQWTVGKLNCQNCGARLGGFNFINHARCPCGQSIAVHISKSRVDPDHQHRRSACAVQPRRTRPEGERGCFLRDQQGACHRKEQESPELFRDVLAAGSQFGAAVASHANPQSRPIAHHTEARSMDGEATQSLLLGPASAVSFGRRCALEDDGSGGSSGSADETQLARRTGTVQCVRSPPFDDVPRHPAVSRGRRSMLDQQQQTTTSTMEGVVSSSSSSAAVPAPPPEDEEASDSLMFLRGRTISDSIGEEAGREQEEPVSPQPSSGSSAGPNRANKKERNRLKSNRRKQRRRERWLHSQLEQEQNSLLTDSEEDDREGYTCAVCLEVYYSPYSCHPCGHVFCEPCLRTLAKNRANNTPCPLCRTLISSTLLQKDLNQTVKTFFPKIYNVRKQNFQRATCAKWPLPSCRKRFRIFWGYQRPAAGRRWHIGQAGFTLDALDLADMRGWLFDIDLVIIYIHSVNWILAFLLLCFLVYFFFS